MKWSKCSHCVGTFKKADKVSALFKEGITYDFEIRWIDTDEEMELRLLNEKGEVELWSVRYRNNIELDQYWNMLDVTDLTLAIKDMRELSYELNKEIR